MNKKIATLAVASSLAVSLSAFASTGPAYNQNGYNGDWSTGWYIGAGVNGDSQGTMDLKNSDVDVFGGTSATTENTEQTARNAGFDVFVGRQVSDWFGGEFGFTYVGDLEFKGTTNAGATTEHIEVKNQWNVHLVGVGKLPLGDYFNAFAKLGGAYMQQEQEYKPEGAANFTDKTHGFALTYGVGVELVWEQFGIRGEYNVLAPTESVRDDFYVSDVISANVFYKFM